MSANQEKLSAKLSPKELFNDKKCMILMIEKINYKIFYFLRIFRFLRFSLKEIECLNLFKIQKKY